jgi:hypothetical protein
MALRSTLSSSYNLRRSPSYIKPSNAVVLFQWAPLPSRNLFQDLRGGMGELALTAYFNPYCSISAGVWSVEFKPICLFNNYHESDQKNNSSGYVQVVNSTMWATVVLSSLVISGAIFYIVISTKPSVRPSRIFSQTLTIA